MDSNDRPFRPIERNGRDEIAIQVMAVLKEFALHEDPIMPLEYRIADFILADRKAVLERVKKPLADIKHEDQTRTDGWVTDYQLWRAVDKALEEIDLAINTPGK